MISGFRCSENEEGMFEVIYDASMSMEVILFKLLYLISLIVFSNIGSGSNFAALKLLLIQRGSKFSSKDVVILLMWNWDGSLTDISFITSASSKIYGVF